MTKHVKIKTPDNNVLSAKEGYLCPSIRIYQLDNEECMLNSSNVNTGNVTVNPFGDDTDLGGGTIPNPNAGSAKRNLWENEQISENE
jgi:hypothetical protein